MPGRARWRKSGPPVPAGAAGAPASWPGAAPLLQAPIRSRGLRLTGGILDSGGIALVTATPSPGAGGDADEPPGRLALEVAGFGPHGPGLAAELAAHIQAWDAAGQPGVDGLHVEAYPRSAADEPVPAKEALLIERPGTRFAVYHN